MDKETYLGDGLYASCDGYQIWLRAPSCRGEQKVALDASVFKNLVAYEKQLRAESAERVAKELDHG